MADAPSRAMHGAGRRSARRWQAPERLHVVPEQRGPLVRSDSRARERGRLTGLRSPAPLGGPAPPRPVAREHRSTKRDHRGREGATCAAVARPCLACRSARDSATGGAQMRGGVPLCHRVAWQHAAPTPLGCLPPPSPAAPEHPARRPTGPRGRGEAPRARLGRLAQAAPGLAGAGGQKRDAVRGRRPVCDRAAMATRRTHPHWGALPPAQPAHEHRITAPRGDGTEAGRGRREHASAVA